MIVECRFSLDYVFLKMTEFQYQKRYEKGSFQNPRLNIFVKSHKVCMSRSGVLNVSMAQNLARITAGETISMTKLTHWGRVTHICVSDLTIIGSDNGLSPGRRQAIIRTNAGILLLRPLGTNFSEILIEILIFSFKKMHLKVSSAKRRPFCLGLNVLTGSSCKQMPASFYN